jgi:hypothetical protein
VTEDIFQELKNRIGVDVPWSIIDEVVVSNQNILRPVKGYAFEILFDEIANKHLKCKIKPGPGGDTDIDRVLINNEGKEITLQIKTCSASTIVKNVQFGISLHKTHGEEKRPKNLYPLHWPCPYCDHEGEAFPDFLVALHPEKGILIVPKEKIPESKTYKGHYADPAIFNWNSEWANRWDLLGFPAFRGQSLERRFVPKQEKLPRIAEIVHLTDQEIVQMWLMPENFRTLEMNLKGNLRQPAFLAWLKHSRIESHEPTDIAYPKYDLITSKGTKIQVKGPSKHLCDTTNNIIGVEVMGSHRQDAGRRYSESDFDYLGLVIDPRYIPDDIPLDKSHYHFCLIPLKELPLHYKNKEWGTNDRIYEGCKFIIKSNSSGCFLSAYTDYRIPVTFRCSGPWYIDEIQESI